MSGTIDRKYVENLLQKKDSVVGFSLCSGYNYGEQIVIVADSGDTPYSQAGNFSPEEFKERVKFFRVHVGKNKEINSVHLAEPRFYKQIIKNLYSLHVEGEPLTIVDEDSEEKQFLEFLEKTNVSDLCGDGVE